MDEERIYAANERPEDEVAREIGPEFDADLHDDPAAPPLDEPDGFGPEMAAVRPWRIAQALETLRHQINAAFPTRDKAADGGIGDAAHASRNSDHNPWVIDAGKGVVTARDFTHHPASGADGNRLAEALRASRDPRIKYLIWNRRICSSSAIGAVAAWTWRAYTGKNPHNHHFHLSVKPEKAHYDSTTPWGLPRDGVGAAVASTEAESDDPLGAIEAALAAVGASGSDRLLLERLVDAQDEIAALLALHAEATHARAEERAEDAGTDFETKAAAVPDFAALKPRYEQLYASLTIPARHAGAVAWHRKRLIRFRERYEEVAARTAAPWWFVGIVHALEASFSFTGHLHNGDPLTRRTVRVPRGRPPRWNPPSDWAASAVDAIEHDGHANQADWSLARALHRFEGYNGFGYHSRGIESPYLWSFSNHYTKGKFVRDGVYDANAVSKQCGAAVMLRALELAGEVRL